MENGKNKLCIFYKLKKTYMKIKLKNFHICFFVVYKENYSEGQIKYKIILSETRWFYLIEKLCNKLTKRIQNKMPEIDEERAEVINYGLQLVLGEIPKTFIILLIDSNNSLNPLTSTSVNRGSSFKIYIAYASFDSAWSNPVVTS